MALRRNIGTVGLQPPQPSVADLIKQARMPTVTSTQTAPPLVTNIYSVPQVTAEPATPAVQNSVTVPVADAVAANSGLIIAALGIGGVYLLTQKKGKRKLTGLPKGSTVPLLLGAAAVLYLINKKPATPAGPMV